MRDSLISTHAPLAGRDWPRSSRASRPKYFNPRAPCGARRSRTRFSRSSSREFQPTRPLRGATRHGAGVPRAGGISTHAPLAGRDQALRPRKTHTDYFNPRAPCGARLSTPPIPHRSYQFQPTRPLRGATCLMLFPCKIELVFQPTRPLRGATAVNRCRRRAYQNFNPRAPCGARRRWKDRKLRRADISTHAPLAGRDDSAG